MVLVIASAVLVFLASAVLARSMAVRRGLNPIFWTAMGFSFGPLVFPILLLVRGKPGL